jgi:molybdopterin converting factor subunit 1
VKEVRLVYFASFRENSGVAEEKVSTNAETTGELYEELRARHGFSHEPETLRVAVNEKFVSWDSPLRDGDEVVFLTPFGGGSCSP